MSEASILLTATQCICIFIAHALALLTAKPIVFPQAEGRFLVFGIIIGKIQIQLLKGNNEFNVFFTNH